MSVRDLRDLINMTEEKIKQKMEQRDSLANNRSDARLSAQNSSNSSIIVQLSLKDLVDRYCHEQQLNPVIQNCNVIIEKVNNHPQGDLFRIQQLFLDDKKEYIFTDASRQKAKGVIYMAMTLDSMLMRRLGNNEFLEFDL